jgi:hypothetical protein
MVGTRWQQDAWVDTEVRRTDPVGARLDGVALGSAIEEAGHRIVGFTSQERPNRRRVLRTPRRLFLIGLLLLGASGAAAAASGVFVNANTHTYNHGWQRYAGGPGENLTGAGTNFVQVVRKESAGAGIVFPAAYVAWRSYEVKFVRRSLCRAQHGCAQESTGMLNANLAQSAFCSWVLEWRQAELAGNTATAREAAAVISEVLRWKALTDLKYIKIVYSQSFGWMRPFMRAVAAENVSKVNSLIASNDGAYFWLWDPRGFQRGFSKLVNRTPKGPRQIALGRDEGALYLRFIDRRGS